MSRFGHLPPISDALLTLTDAQQSAIATLAMTAGDDDARRSVSHWIRAWDVALKRGDTIQTADRIRRARDVWDGYLYQDGAGI